MSTWSAQRSRNPFGLTDRQAEAVQLLVDLGTDKAVAARLGITASKKSGDSVARSRIKRVVREAFRLNPQAFPKGWDFVVIAREGADKLTMQEAAEELLGAPEVSIAHVVEGDARIAQVGEGFHRSQGCLGHAGAKGTNPDPSGMRPQMAQMAQISL